MSLREAIESDVEFRYQGQRVVEWAALDDEYFEVTLADGATRAVHADTPVELIR